MGFFDELLNAFGGVSHTGSMRLGVNLLCMVTEAMRKAC